MALINYLDLDIYSADPVKVKIKNEEIVLPKKVAKYELVYQKYLKTEKELSSDDVEKKGENFNYLLETFLVPLLSKVDKKFTKEFIEDNFSSRECADIVSAYMFSDIKKEELEEISKKDNKTKKK